MKNQIKMIVTDLDGTLFTEEKIVTEKSRDVLLKCRNAGIKVIYATGRSGGGLSEIIPNGLFDGHVVNNGSIARDKDIVIYSRLIPYQNSREFLLLCDKNSLEAASQFDGMHYANFDFPELWSLRHLKVDFAQHDKDAEKIYINDCDEKIFELLKANLPHDTYITVSRDGFGFIMHVEATKSKAVAALANNWGIKQEEILAFGDDLNDIDMLEYAGISVAMENALDEVKAVADFICLSNEDDGLAHWIEENIL